MSTPMGDSVQHPGALEPQYHIRPLSSQGHSEGTDQAVRGLLTATPGVPGLGLSPPPKLISAHHCSGGLGAWQGCFLPAPCLPAGLSQGRSRSLAQGARWAHWGCPEDLVAPGWGHGLGYGTAALFPNRHFERDTKEAEPAWAARKAEATRGRATYQRTDSEYM
ncbi:hypothetical protein HJG60_008067 [Phyllostomus discolor]|uniref:Uncharacterized protein n=1 Tax=Phyllostomus discolor TaxID=89673 RepID=A0A834EYI0_9CHIR|nr:hypothetical protein HJG60_008067 [Phyllostomus discolor]